MPFAPINKPIDLVSDPHMLAGGLVEITLSNGETIKLPSTPVEFDGERPGLRKNLPEPGQGAKDHLAALGFDAERIESLVAQGVMIAE